MAKKKKKLAKPAPDAGQEAVQVQQQPSGAQVVQAMKNEITLSIENAKENIMRVFNVQMQNLAGSVQQINQLQAENTRLRNLCKEHGVNTNPPVPKKLNRAQRRRIERNQKKNRKTLIQA